ncbi:methyltransferase [Thermoactinospora rubra]|uniref:methyltransferase n=1 Tax=Thermoactinospora rubra TaxID=1088767 RepID=UPI000A1072CC|nr:methyltransferase [Thermoactinospora rubra]
MPLYLDPDDLRDFRDRNQAPGALLDLVGAMAFRAAAAAQRLGVFQALRGRPRAAAQLSAVLGCSARQLAVLLDALVAFGYLERDGNAYALGPAANPWLDRTAPGNFAAALAVWDELLGSLWTGMEEAVRSGLPREPYYPWLEKRPETLRDFQSMLAGLARLLAPAVVEAAPPLAGRLLDIGGGHAIYSLAFCSAAPEATATVVDLPGALEEGRTRAEAAGLADRLTFVPGDLADPIDGRYDAVLLFNVCHGLDEQAGRELIARARGALGPGGIVLVLEPFADAPARPHDTAFLRGFSLNLAITQGGRLYAFDEVAAWAREAGFARVERRALAAPTTDELLVAWEDR